jgi:leucyl aminopeptidase
MKVKFLDSQKSSPKAPLVVLVLDETRFKQLIKPTSKKQNGGISKKELSVSLQNQVIDVLKKTKFSLGKQATLDFPLVASATFSFLAVVDISKLSPRKASEHIAKSLTSVAKKYSCTSAFLSLSDEFISSYASCKMLVQELTLCNYSFTKFKSKTSKETKLQEVSFFLSPALLSEFKARDTLKSAEALSAGVALTRDLVNLPALDCTPRHVVEECNLLAKSFGVELKVFDRKKLEQFGAGGILGVSRGSSTEPYLACLKYIPTNGKPKKKVALVGKGVTFDSGGLSIKSGEGMMWMKYDMAGAATVIGVMRTIAETKPDIQVEAYLPLVENMVSGTSIHPGDVLKTVSGKTVEVLNTDAEGRLILADALEIAEQGNPDVIIDVATLTGAVVVALGTSYTGYFTRSDELSEQLNMVANNTEEGFWRLPLDPNAKKKLKSSIADLKNIGDRWGGAVSAAVFLSHFVKTENWLHLDIAGTAFSEHEEPKGGTGHGVKTLVELLDTLSKQ